jgi:tRNA(Ile)-lysidine synthase
LSPDELLTECEKAKGLLVGVSGGPDSMALLLLASQWRTKPGHPPVFSATVDHGLRPNSRSEAERVGEWSRALGVKHFILAWEGPKPLTRIQERARDARYALLEQCADQLDASLLLTAHHADDQCETILFRLLRGSGVGGLAGMARATQRGRLTHMRPLLHLPKSALVDFCDSLGHSYFKDPSNEDPRFARVRLRRAAAALEELGMRSEGLLRLSRRAARAEAALRSSAESLARTAVAEQTETGASLRCQALRDAPEELALRVILVEATRLSGRAPRLEQAEKLTEDLLNALRTNAPFRASLAGILFSLRGEALELRPEPPRRPRRLDAGASSSESQAEEGPPPSSAHSLVKGRRDA